MTKKKAAPRAKKKTARKPKKKTTKRKPSRAEDVPVEMVAVADLKPHPRNYRKHPADQIAHIVSSIEEHGFYRNVVACRDGTIVAGHGVVEAAISVGIERVPVVRLDISPDDPRALKVMAGDNLISHLSEDDDRALADLLKELSSIEELVGTGFDERMLANFAMVTRPSSEIKGTDAAAEWVGMPEFETEGPRIRLVVCFDSEVVRDELVEKLDVVIKKKSGLVWSTWYPKKNLEDLNAVEFVG